MAFCYCEAGRLGWRGPWREAARHALDYLRRHFIAADGSVVSVVGLDGSPVAGATGGALAYRAVRGSGEGGGD